MLIIAFKICGIYGAEAASKLYFGLKAKDLTRYQAISIVAIFPGLLKWNAGKPGPYVQSRIKWINLQMGRLPQLREI